MAALQSAAAGTFAEAVPLGGNAHATDPPGVGAPVLAKIDQLKAVYGLTLTAADAHKLKEQS